ncbi:hypothetical protein D3C75_1058100 [compost metagenome]
MDMKPVFAGNKIEGLHLDVDAPGHLRQLRLAHLGAVCANELHYPFGTYVRADLSGLHVVRAGNGRE